MSYAPFFEFKCPEGYAAGYTAETIRQLHSRKRGRPSIRFDIFTLEGINNVVAIANVTASQLRDYRIMAEKQGNKIW